MINTTVGKNIEHIQKENKKHDGKFKPKYISNYVDNKGGSYGK